MLTHFRKQKKVLAFFLWLVIAAFIGTIFLVWGMGGNISNAAYAIKVNDYKISYGEYRDTYENTANTLRQIFGDQLNQIPEYKNLGKKVADDMVSKILVTEDAKSKGIFVSDMEVLEVIKSNSAFLTDNNFDTQKYVQVLNLNGINPEVYENSLKQDILFRKMENIVKNSVAVTDLEIENEFKYRNSEAVIKFLSVEPKKFQDKVVLSDTDLKNYYSSNGEKYRVPETVKVKYTVIDPSNYVDNFTVSGADLETYYLQHKNEFIQKEEVEARHILFRVKDFNDKQQDNASYQRALNVLGELKKGGDFIKLAEKYSDDSTAKNGGYLGKFQRGAMVKEFEDVAFLLKEGDVSDIVKTPFGYHILKVEKHIPEKELTLDEAKDKINAILEKELKKNSFNKYVFDLYKNILTESNITAYQKKYPDKITVYETEMFDINSQIAPFGSNSAVKKIIFHMDLAEVSSVVEMNGKKYIFELTDRKESFIPEFDKVADEVKKDYISEKSYELSAKYLDEQIKSSKSVDEISKNIKVSYTTSPSFKRLEPIPELGANSLVATEIFNKEKGLLEKTYEFQGKPYVIEVVSVKDGDINKLQEQRNDIQTFLLSVKQDEAFKAYVKGLKSSAKIEIAQGLYQE